MTTLAADFVREYRRGLEELLPMLTPERMATLGRHNPGWDLGTFDVGAYLRASEVRYLKALELGLAGGRDPEGLEVLDIGGFMGAFPLAMARLGASVTLSEKYSYYYGAFDEIRDKLEANGIEVWDEDLTEPLDPLPDVRHDLITAMAIIEHLANSPRPLLDTARGLLAERGRLIVEVPNIAYWPKRLAMLSGKSPNPPLRDVFHSEPPFTGHHREYTWEELESVLEWSGMTVERISSFNYTPQDVPPIWRPLYVWPSRRERCRETLIAVAGRPPSVPVR